MFITQVIWLCTHFYFMTLKSCESWPVKCAQNQTGYISEIFSIVFTFFHVPQMSSYILNHQLNSVKPWKIELRFFEILAHSK